MASSSAADDEKRKGKRPMYQDEQVSHATAAAAAAEVEKPEQVVEEQKPTLVLVAEDGVEVRISEPAAKMSQMLLHLIQDGCADDRIPTPNVRSYVLQIVVEYCEKHAPHYDPKRDRNPFPPFPVDLPPAVSSIKPVTYVDPDPHGLMAWDKEFIAQFDNSDLFEIILAANYLSIEDLLELGTTTVADKMRGRMPEEIREIFEIENDYTPEQEAEVREENAWAFED